jgi:septal ring factor EnvC (AmiA/AmiB activator)
VTRCAALLVAALLAGAAPAWAATDAAGRIAAASAGIAEAEAAPEQVAALGRAVGAYQAALAALGVEVAEAGRREQALALDLADRRIEIQRLLAALGAMSRTPRPAQALHPEGPLGAARAAAMMARLTPAMQERAQALAEELAALRTARRLHAESRAGLEAGLARLGAAQAALSAAMAAASPQPADPGEPTVTMMARDSETLSALAAALARTGDAPEPPAEGGADKLLWPVAGQVLRHFNEPDAAGVRRPGIIVEAAPLALVQAPADAIVRYAGPFLEYGYVVVLEPDAGTMGVLAGLAQLRVRTGTPVGRGELIGLLGGRALDVEEYVMLPASDTGAGGGETLYIEARQGRGPVDPEPLFEGEDG